MSNNIADNLEQCGQQNIVQCCFHQARTGFAFLAVYFCVLSFISPGSKCSPALIGNGQLKQL